MKFLLPLALLLSLCFSGCAHYSVDHEPGGVDLRQYKRLWVKTNYDDNHATSVRIVEALRLLDFDVGAGPITLMPNDRQAVVEYRDNWSWDFRDHMVSLELKFMEPKEKRMLAMAQYYDSASLFTDASSAISDLLYELLDGKAANRARAVAERRAAAAAATATAAPTPTPTRAK